MIQRDPRSTTSAPASIACAVCGRQQKTTPTATGKLRTPKGWHGETCPQCWRQKYVLRAITVSVAEPRSGTWEELRAALALMWRQTTAASNWIMTELYARDARRNSSDEKMPAMVRQYLYPEIRAQWPDLTPQSVSSLEQAAKARYRAKRYEIIWTRAASLPSLRYPQPFPIHNQSWSVHLDDGGRPILSARIGASHWELRLRSGARYRRQLAAIRLMESGDAVRGEAAIYRAHDGEILVKLVAWLPRRAAGAAEGILYVRTAADHLLHTLDSKGGRLWTENADHVRRWIAGYARQLERLRQDRKAEQRPTLSFAERQETLVRKQRNRMGSAVREIAAHLVGFARRRKYAALHYHDEEQGFAASFPWFLLRERIKTLCDEHGIMFEHASSETMPPEAGPHTEGEDQ